jgi:DeoR family transcriptional regulator, fructose operon transcriptional repressor
MNIRIFDKKNYSDHNITIDNSIQHFRTILRSIMLTEERRLQIAKYVKDKGSTTIHELADNFNVTLMTINRDLRKLDKEGKIKTVRGGAIAKNLYIEESFFPQRIKKSLVAKEILADKAVKLITPGDSLLLDSSTTATILCRRIIKEDLRNITIITNNITIINELMTNNSIEVLSTGGTILNKFNCFVGPLAELLISQIRATKLFFSVVGVSIEGELTDTDIQEANIKKKMMEVASEKILLAGSHKFNKVGLYKISDLENIDLVITDLEKIEGAFIEEIKKKEVMIK